MKILIKNGRVLDPRNYIDKQADIYISNGRIISVGTNIAVYSDAQIIDATGLWVTPGLIDMHVHLRDPGQLHKETIATGTAAAAAGGFTTVACMPNTAPVIDTAKTVRYVNDTSAKTAKIRVVPVGAITKYLGGEQLSEIRAMKDEGIAALTDDGKTVGDKYLLAEAMTLAKSLDLPVLSHCEPEEEIIERDISIAKETGVRLHICHVSTKKGVELIRAAQKSGQAVTAEAAPHHFTLTADDAPENDADFKMAPPLRTHADREAILAALADGTISVIATDHAPHLASEKTPYSTAANGIIGLETAVPLAITELVLGGILTPLELIAKLTANPAKILGLTELGHLSQNSIADIAIIAPAAKHRIDKNAFLSKSRNTPFHGREVTGRVVYTIYKGDLT